MSNSLSNEAFINYEKALSIGKKEGKTPLVLDNILKEKNIVSFNEIPLGLVQVPMELVVGTKTEGRANAFSKNFYPVMECHTEFSDKWIRLYQSHIEEGIHDPIQAYEYMNRFYVAEGNKRVSVLKYLKAATIQANVIRIIPPRTEEKENKIYYEFMDFYRLSGINYIWFTKEGSFAKLQRLTGKIPDFVWTETEKDNFNSVFTRFTKEFQLKKGQNLNITVGDAFLSFLEIYDYADLVNMEQSEMHEKVNKSWDEFKLLLTDDPIELQMTPMLENKKNFFMRLIPVNVPQQRAAFIYGSTILKSGWTYAHELGRRYLQKMFAGQINTSYYEGATEENADELLNKAVEDGNNLIFTTSPLLLKASLKTAVEHTDVKILNCSLNTAHRHIRTYYARMYEPKFLMGAIAGAISSNGKIGYIADYPVWGTIANINAFALGAKMVNSRAQIYLEWTKVKQKNINEKFLKNGVEYISGKDILTPVEIGCHFGLYRAEEKSPLNVAMPVWNWGKFYEQMIRNIMNGSWKYDDPLDDKKGLNYWWGMSAGIVDVYCSKHLPIGTTRLIALLRKTICNGDFNPFSGILYSQNGIVQKDKNKSMSPEEIINMNWLAENVIGSIPKMDDLKEKAKPMILLQGVEGVE
ncbi:MAG: BMP family ABC transporter substrate-binding protein [Firmicutes bacterium]|nr:BMP family ABC transporter substrate-binding protein [Bacillota bacterium]